jgi:universal stress protein A
MRDRFRPPVPAGVSFQRPRLCQAIPEDTMIKIRRILFPTDFSQNANAALVYAQHLAEQNEAELHVLHVIEDVGYLLPIPEFGVPSLMNFEETRAAAEKSLNRVVNAEWAKAHKVVRDLRKGSPFLEIIRHAQEKNVDLIVMSTHGRTGLAHLILGSVAENVVRKSSCPVLTVHPEEHRFVKP